jgi:hypothetical protein
MSGYGNKFENNSFIYYSSYSTFQTTFILNANILFIGKHDLYALITDYNGKNNYIKDDYLIILKENKIVDELKIYEKVEFKYLKNTNVSQSIILNLNDSYFDVIENICLYNNNSNNYIISNKCSNDNKNYNCSFSDLSSESTREYEICYINSCGGYSFFNNKTTNKNVTVKILSESKIEKIIPNYIYDDEISSGKEITIYFD